MLTQPKLMQIGWFATLYNTVMPWKEALFERIRASWAWRYARGVKARAKLAVRRLGESLRPHLERARTYLRDLWRRVTVRFQS